MKKSLVVLLLLGAILGGQVAHAVAVDWSTQMYSTSGYSVQALILNKCALDKDRNGQPSDATHTQPNGMLDWAEFAVLQNILANPANPNHATVYAAWMNNLSVIDGWVTGTYETIAMPFEPYIAATLTVGGPTARAAMEAWIGTNMALLGAFPTTFIQCDAILGSTGDADGDGYTNKQEYDAAAIGADLTTDAGRTAFFSSYATGATTTNVTELTCTITKTPAPPTLFEGATITFTATAQAATGAVTYQWFKGATAVGTGATFTIPSAVAADSGSYTAVATDSSSPLPQQDTSNAITVNVLAASNLPVMGFAGIALLVGLAGALGVRKLRK